MVAEEMFVTRNRRIVASTNDKPEREAGLHVAIIMDGNGRWATARGLPRIAGHKAGAQAVRRTTRRAAELGVATLTMFAFSSDNWRRPQAETKALMRLLRVFLMREGATCRREGIRFNVIGRRDRLAPELCELIRETEIATRDGERLNLRIAIDYSARDSILRAVENLMTDARPNVGERGGVTANDINCDEREFSPLRRERFAAFLGGAQGDGDAPSPDVDLLIRTGGEQRLSDFLLWESAYAEFLFTPVMFPDFGRADLDAALAEFHRRERRFGCVPQTAGQAKAVELENAGTISAARA